MIKSNGNQSKFLVFHALKFDRCMCIKHKKCLEIIAKVVLLMYSTVHGKGNGEKLSAKG